MKKIILKSSVLMVAIFLSVLFVVPAMIYADAAFNFVEYAGNPLFGGATSGVDRAYQPYVIKIGGMYHMWYGDGANARYISSTYPDFRDAQYPGTIVSGTTASQPYKFTVYYNPDGWTLGETHYPQKLVAYYTDAVGSWSANPKIAVSDNGINWTFVAQTTGVQEYPSPGALYRLSVLYEGNNTWKGYGDQGQAIIQYYTSTNGINWTGVATDLLHLYTPSLLQPWEGGPGAISPYVFKKNNTYVMTYSAGETDNNQAIGIAYSENGINFTKSSTNPIFSIGDNVAWRTDRTYNSYIMYDDGLWRMYFQGNKAPGIYAVGMATSAIPVTSITVTGEDTVVNGGSITLGATVAPSNATNNSVTWSVATLVGGTATINAAGSLTGTGVGTVTVTATANDGSGITGTKVVTTTEAPATTTTTQAPAPTETTVAPTISVLGITKLGIVEQTVSEGTNTVDASSVAGASATITGSGGQTVKIEKISSATASEGGFSIEGATSYVDLHLDTSEGVEQIQFAILGGAGIPRSLSENSK